MKINVEGNKAVIKANVGDVVYLEYKYWIIGAGLDTRSSRSNHDMCYYLVALDITDTEEEDTTLVLNNVNSDDELRHWLLKQEAIVYDGKRSSINLVYKKSK